MNKYFTIQAAQRIPLNPRMEMPSILVIGLGLLAASPLGGTLLFNNAGPLPANLVQLFGLVNSLVLERYFYRALMTAGYIVQHHSKVIAAIPVALQVISEAIERIGRVLFDLPGRIYLQATLTIKDSAENVTAAFRKYTSGDRVEINGVVERELLVVQETDDFLWQMKYRLKGCRL